MPRQNAKSKAQTELRHKVEDAYPTAYVIEEVYIGDLIDEQGYTMKEIERELGNKPHRMFVDIVCRDSERTIAFEYHGEQHYHKNSRTMKTDAALLMNQQLDREKSWILQRIGIPLVVVPFDMYVDQDVLDKLTSDAVNELEEAWSKYIECPECGRFFPDTQLPAGMCHRCYAEKQERIEREKQASRDEKQKEQKEYQRSKRSDFRKHLQDSIEADPELAAEWEQQAAERKQQAREYRRQKYREWKQSDEYAKQQAEMKRRRREAYREAKAKRAQEKASWRSNDDEAE